MYSWFGNRLVENTRMRLTAEATWEFCLHGLGVARSRLTDRDAVALLGVGERVVLVTRVEPAVLAHERRRPAADPPAVVGAHVFVAVPTEPHGVRLLVDEHEVLEPRWRGRRRTRPPACSR